MTAVSAPVTTLLGGVAVRAVYQPIVELDTGTVVAYEALARGPEGSSLERPEALFAAARAAGLLGELDWECRAAAFGGALDARLSPPTALFVNVEPASLTTPLPAHLADVRQQAEAELRIVVEVTERALTRDPAGLLEAVAAARATGFALALDDVGAHPASLALMPFLEPDVIKLDLRLIQDRTTAGVADIVNAVAAQAERSGAVVLAEGVETEEHRLRALALGATLGQGWLFGRPGSLPAVPGGGGLVIPRVGTPGADGRTPFEAVAPLRSVRRATKRLLIPMSEHLERYALRAVDPPVLLATFQAGRNFTPATARRYAELRRHCSFVAALGAGLPPEPVPGVRGADLRTDDPLVHEWVVAVVGPHFAGALVARDLGDDGPDLDRRFDVVITHDRALALSTARMLMERVVPAG